MNQYTADKIINLAVAGPAGAGKTTLSEALLAKTGALSRQGSVADGNTVSDFDPEEIKRKTSIHAALLAFEHGGRKINLLDCPGYGDFVGELVCALSAVEGTAIILDAASGMGAGLDTAWQEANRLNLAKMIVLNKMDKKQADFDGQVEAVRKKLGDSVVAVQVPLGKEAAFKGTFSLLSDAPPPAEVKDECELYRDTLVAAAAETDEKLMDAYLQNKPISREELLAAVKKAIAEKKITPIVCVSSETGAGIDELLKALADFMPSADRSPYSKEPAPAALAFKTSAEAHVGDLNYIRVFSGEIKHGGAFYNLTQDKEEKAGQIYTLVGKNRLDMPVICAGDIGVLPKLRVTKTADKLGDKKNPSNLPDMVFPEPLVSVSVKPKTKGDEEKMALGLESLMHEDSTFQMRYDGETRETVVSAMGDIHLDVMLSRLKARYNIEIETGAPRIPYKETIRGRARGQGKYKKQTGGHGQYGDVWLELDPLARGSGFVFEEKIFGGAVPKNYIPAVEKGIREALVAGVVAGYPVVDLKVTLVDGSYHEVDSSDMAFKIAASMGFKKIFMDARPVILEPIVNLSVQSPPEFLGDITGDLNKRRGKITAVETDRVTALVPLAELASYAGALHSMTHGRGGYTYKFARYEDAPGGIQEKLISIYTKLKEAGELREKAA